MTTSETPRALHPLFRTPTVLLDLVQQGETVVQDAHTPYVCRG